MPLFFPALIYPSLLLALGIDQLEARAVAEGRGRHREQVEDLYRELRKAVIVEHQDRELLGWMNANKKLVLSLLWAELPKPPTNQGLYVRFHNLAAPVTGAAELVPPVPRAVPWDRTGAVSRRMLTLANTLLHDPDFYVELAEGLGWPEDQNPHFDDEASLLVIADWIGVPSHDATGELLEPWQRADIAELVVELVGESTEDGWGTSLSLEVDPRYETRGEQERGWITKIKRKTKTRPATPYQAQLGPRPKALDYGPLADGVAEAVLTDALADFDGLRLVEVDRETGRAFIERYHSKLPELPDRTMFILGAMRGDRLVAVATAGHPSGQWADQQNVLELTRVASDGTTQNAASMLTGRIMDLLPQARRGDPGEPMTFATYSLSSEEGSTYLSLADKNLRPTQFNPGSKHAAPGGRRKTQKALADVDKIRWEAGPGAAPADWGLLDRVKNRLYKPWPGSLYADELIGFQGFAWDHGTNTGIPSSGATVPLKLNYLHEAPHIAPRLVPRWQTALEGAAPGPRAVLAYRFHPSHITSGALYDVKQNKRATVRDPELPEVTVSEALVVGVSLFDAEGNVVHQRDLRSEQRGQT